ETPGETVNRVCGSGMQAVVHAVEAIRVGYVDTMVAGGTESMSQVPLLWSREFQQWLFGYRKAGLGERLKLLLQLRPAFFKPVVGLELGLTDPICGLNMGQTAEKLAREFNIAREDQDAFALASHQRAAAAWQQGQFADEVTSVTELALGQPPLEQDAGPRPQQSLAALAKLRPLFASDGTVTAGNSCPITDGAAAVVLMAADQARAEGIQPLGYVRGYAVAGCDPARMGLGPVYAIRKLLQNTGLSVSDFELFEINEAFATQVLACLRAMSSRTFAEQEWGGSAALGEIDPERLNVHGGAIALGHPVGVSGTRLILTLLRSLRDNGRQRGLAALCVGGGQGVAVWVERTLEDFA
ncbi:MAG TPA: thiolase family protein, partial [Planctomycetaceae bacterium]|nr:thiolase family protein [Planctomycetaceae bacterium]